MRVAVAASSQLAADAGGAIAEAGGNAVDAAIAAALVSASTEPGVCALAGGGYVNVWAPGAAPEILDGQVRMPGTGLPAAALGQGAVSVDLAYGGGVTTVVDAGSVGVPAALAALEAASQTYGKVPWAVLFEPVVAITRRGFPLPAASHHYLGYSAGPIFSRSAEGHGALHTAGGRLRAPGEAIVVPGLADSLEAIAQGGAEVFYRGALAEAMVAHVRERGGMLTREDLAGCRALRRPALVFDLADWRIASTPAPALGGTVLGAMLLAARRPPPDTGDPRWAVEIAETQQLALEFRRTRLDHSRDLPADAQGLLALAARTRGVGHTSSSTVHISASDHSGLCCAITLSAGYGSGLMPPGTGLWLNNCLGELELNHRGLVFDTPGTPLPSNMAPTSARHEADGRSLAIGSPGADRITTALQQVLLRHLGLGQGLDAAIAAPRLHLEHRQGAWRAAVEPGLDTSALDLPLQHFDAMSMYFGGVGATARLTDTTLLAAADPRRAGGTWVG